MVPLAIVRQYAVGQRIVYEVGDQDIVLHYALRLLSEAGLVGRSEPNTTPGPLLFKGGTALRKCVFGSTGRFSQDIDLDAIHQNGFEAEIEPAFAERTPFHDIFFSIPEFRYSREGNFSGSVDYEHPRRAERFELQISYRRDPILDSRDLPLQDQPYFARVEFEVPLLHGLDPYEMVGEKIMACDRRLGGSAKDVYDLYLWSERPFAEALVRRIAVERPAVKQGVPTGRVPPADRAVELSMERHRRSRSSPTRVGSRGDLPHRSQPLSRPVETWASGAGRKVGHVARAGGPWSR